MTAQALPDYKQQLEVFVQGHADQGDLIWWFCGMTVHHQSYCIFVCRATRLSRTKFSIGLATADLRNIFIPSNLMKLGEVSGQLEDAKRSVISFGSVISQREKPFEFSVDHGGLNLHLNRDFYKLLVLPKDFFHNPNIHLIEGDEIFVKARRFGYTFYHAGLYVGRNKVIHFTSHDDAPSSRFFAPHRGQIRRESLKDFIWSMQLNDDVPVVFRVVHGLEVRTKDQKVAEATLLLSKNDLFAEYSVRHRNCQHFTSFCSFGQMFSWDLTNRIANFACVLLRPTGIIAGSLRIP